MKSYAFLFVVAAVWAVSFFVVWLHKGLGWPEWWMYAVGFPLTIGVVLVFARLCSPVQRIR